MPVIPITIAVPKMTVIYQLISVFETGSYSPWVHKVEPRGPKSVDDLWYATVDLLKDGDLFSIIYDLPEDNEGTGNGRKIVTMDDVRIGLTMMAEKSPRAFADMLGETGDAITADIFMQYVVLREVVYG